MKYASTLTGSMAIVFAFTIPTHAADYSSGAQALCAVSGLNGKIEGAGGYFEDAGNPDSGRVHVGGSLTAPLGCNWGFQVDAAFGALGNNGAGGIGGHLFTRNPNSYLLGVIGSYSAIGSNSILRIGAEGALYLGQLSLEGLVGYEAADNIDLIPDGTDEDVFGQVLAALYVSDNFRFHGGYRRFLAVDAGIVGFEWMPGNSNYAYSFFAEAQAGDNNYRTVFAGVRFYFGAEDKSLIRRHREDDPFPIIMNILAETCVLPTGATLDSCGNAVGSPPSKPD